MGRVVVEPSGVEDPTCSLMPEQSLAANAGYARPTTCWVSSRAFGGSPHGVLEAEVLQPAESAEKSNGWRSSWPGAMGGCATFLGSVFITTRPLSGTKGSGGNA